MKNKLRKHRHLSRPLNLHNLMCSMQAHNINTFKKKVGIRSLYWAREIRHQPFVLTGQVVTSGGTKKQGKENDKLHKILQGRRIRRHTFMCRMRAINKVRMEKGQRHVQIGPKVKALYEKDRGWSRQVVSMGQRKCCQNCCCFSKYWRSLHWHSYMPFFPGILI